MTDIVREFPNKVTIKISERIALYKIAARSEEGEGYVAVDRNFQRNTIYAEEDLEGMNLIDVKGFAVDGSFVTEECYILRDIANALIQYSGGDGNSIPEEGIPYLVKEIIFDGNFVRISLRTNDSTIVLDRSNDKSIKEQVQSLYRSYRATDVQERDGKVFSL